MSYGITVPASAVGQQWAIKFLGDPAECALLETDGAAYLSARTARGLALLLLSYADKAEANGAPTSLTLMTTKERLS